MKESVCQYLSNFGKKKLPTGKSVGSFGVFKMVLGAFRSELLRCGTFCVEIFRAECFFEDVLRDGGVAGQLQSLRRRREPAGMAKSMRSVPSNSRVR